MESITQIKHRIPLVCKYLRNYQIIQADSPEALIVRLDKLLSNVKGITYVYNYSRFNIECPSKRKKEETLGCNINIYINDGPEKKTPIKYDVTYLSLVSDKMEFIIEHEDLTRYFVHLFRYITENYFAETIASFSSDDIDYWCYCPDYERVEEVELEDSV